MSIRDLPLFWAHMNLKVFGHLREQGAEGLAHTPLEAVALVCFAEAARYGDAEAGQKEGAEEKIDVKRLPCPFLTVLC